MGGDGLAGYACGLGSSACLGEGIWLDGTEGGGGGFDKRYGLTGEEVGVDAGDASGLRGGVGGYHVAVDFSALT